MALEELQRSYLTAVDKHRVRLPTRVPGKVGKAYRSGANLTVGPPTGSDTWEQFLARAHWRRGVTGHRAHGRGRRWRAGLMSVRCSHPSQTNVGSLAGIWLRKGSPD
jgi:hypothetical protein